MLEIESLEVAYGPIRALYGVSLQVSAGELLAVVGPNGAGKTSLLNAVIGMCRPRAGRVRWHGRDVSSMPPQSRLRLGIALVPEHRRVLCTLTVEENLRVAATGVPRRLRRARVADIMERFETLGRLRGRRAGVLSGGEAQQLAIARALVAGPQLLLMDEPTLGLAPLVARQVFDLIRELHASGMALIVVEQNTRSVLAAADHACIMRTGRIVERGAATDLARRADMFGSFLGDDAAAHAAGPKPPSERGGDG